LHCAIGHETFLIKEIASHLAREGGLGRRREEQNNLSFLVWFFQISLYLFNLDFLDPS
jgi:hypothetical protein